MQCPVTTKNEEARCNTISTRVIVCAVKTRHHYDDTGNGICVFVAFLAIACHIKHQNVLDMKTWIPSIRRQSLTGEIEYLLERYDFEEWKKQQR